jgi:16S rRNA (uracil1498-N3)-methyltransferase
MNLLLFSDRDRLENNRVRIADSRLRHLQEVLEAKDGDSLRVGEINGLMGTAQVLLINQHEALIEVDLQQNPPPKVPLTLVLALPRPKMLRRILRMVAEMGVPELHLVNSYRVEKSYWQTPALATETVEEYFLQGLMQSRDTILPQLHLHKRFKPFVEDELPQLTKGRRALVAHPGDHPPCPAASEEPTLLAIGPEGGFIPYEIEKLQAAGCEAISLGPRILRVENAVSALIAKMST